MHCQAVMHPCCHLPGQPSPGDAGTLAHSGSSHAWAPSTPPSMGLAKVLSLLASPEGWRLVGVTLLAGSPGTRYQPLVPPLALPAPSAP